MTVSNLAGTPWSNTPCRNTPRCQSGAAVSTAERTAAPAGPVVVIHRSRSRRVRVMAGTRSPDMAGLGPGRDRDLLPAVLAVVDRTGRQGCGARARLVRPSGGRLGGDRSTAARREIWPSSRRHGGRANWRAGSTGWPARRTRSRRRTCDGRPGTGVRAITCRSWPGRCVRRSPNRPCCWPARRPRGIRSQCCRSRLGGGVQPAEHLRCRGQMMLSLRSCQLQPPVNDSVPRPDKDAQPVPTGSLSSRSERPVTVSACLPGCPSGRTG